MTFESHSRGPTRLGRAARRRRARRRRPLAAAAPQAIMTIAAATASRDTPAVTVIGRQFSHGHGRQHWNDVTSKLCIEQT